MRYESAVNSAGGDDVALAKSFIIACDGPVLNWYSLLPPHSVCSWVDLKTKFMQAFQMFHDTTTESSDLYNCKQKDREPGSETSGALESFFVFQNPSFYQYPSSPAEPPNEFRII
jgi:hypothetical protein